MFYTFLSVPKRYWGTIPNPASTSIHYLLMRLSEILHFWVIAAVHLKETHCDWMPGHKLGSFHWLAVVGDPELNRWGFVAAKQFLERRRTETQRQHSSFNYSSFMSNTWTFHRQPIWSHAVIFFCLSEAPTWNWLTGFICHWRMKSLT